MAKAVHLPQCQHRWELYDRWATNCCFYHRRLSKWLWREKVPWTVHQRAEDVAACRCQSFSTANVRTGGRYQQWRNAGGCAQLRLQRQLLPFRNCLMPYPGAQALWEHQMELKKRKTHWIASWEQQQVILGKDRPTGVLAWAGPVLCTTSTEEPLIHGAPYGNNDALLLPSVMALNTAYVLPWEAHLQSSQSRWGFAYFCSTLDNNRQYWNDAAATQKYL